MNHHVFFNWQNKNIRTIYIILSSYIINKYISNLLKIPVQISETLLSELVSGPGLSASVSVVAS